MTVHEQVKASRATVDKGLAELLECLWANGIDTQYSCQGGDRDSLHPKGHDAMIVFATVDDALQFMQTTMRRSFWYNRLTMELADRLYDPDTDTFGPVRASVHWPVKDRITGIAVTPALTDVWADRQRDGDLFTRHPLNSEDVRDGWGIPRHADVLLELANQSTKEKSQ